MSKVLDYLSNRRSIKNFNKYFKLNDNDIKKILESIRMAPTSFNLQPFKALYISKEEIKKDFFEYWWKQNSVIECSGIIIWLVYKEEFLKNKYIDNQISKLVDPENTKRIEGMNKGISYIMRDREISYEEWAIRQCYITMGSMLAVAEELGIDTCPIEGYKTSATNEILQKYNLIDLNTETVALACVVGKKDGEQNEHFSKIKKRLQYEELFKII
ncbi:Nitroreductase [Spiroplasma litorale]|uniref:Nitroreductase n=1 Tax=Spiroplasma litorale TaxID=216942 RepID=A0A0K1W373_9MOLU|nr:nitroreductase family protein [Spiroplasma litorale]AKX34557.1 Nitroreductase [Spiroplasma litorale]